MLSYYKNKRVLITGHTGFKGSWLCKVLQMSGAQIMGYALEPPTTPNLFGQADLVSQIDSIIGDIRDYEKLERAFTACRPQIVFHLAAQPLVLEGYRAPRTTYDTNVMGTVNILECVRLTDYVESFVNVTTDKVYLNREWSWGYRECDVLDGYDPYSNSKSCSELVTSSYRNSFFKQKDLPLSTARAGNVIGGGDYAENRIIPDCIRAAGNGKRIEVRNPHSIRPYQHVLEPIFAYLIIAAKQAENHQLASNYNIGPVDSDCVTTETLVSHFCHAWGNGAEWGAKEQANAPHEASFLKLDCSRAKEMLGWKPVWNIQEAVQKTVDFAKASNDSISINEIMEKQINEYQEVLKDV